MSRPDKDAYLARYKGQRKRRLQLPEDGIKTKEQLIDYLNKCEVMVDTIIVFEQIRDLDQHLNFRQKAEDLYKETESELFKEGDLVDEDKMIEPFKQKLIKMVQDSDFNESSETKEENFGIDMVADIAKSNVELGKKVLGLGESKETSNKYKFTYYLNTATSERRQTTPEDIEEDWKVEERNYSSDVEAFEYAYKELLDYDEDDLNDLYEDLNDPNNDLEKIDAIQHAFRNQDLGSGDTIIISIEGPGQAYDSGFEKDDFMGEIEFEDIDEEDMDEFDENLSLEEATMRALLEDYSSIDANVDVVETDDEAPYLSGYEEKDLDIDDRYNLSEEELWATGWRGVIQNITDGPFDTFDDMEISCFDNEKDEEYDLPEISEDIKTEFTEKVNKWIEWAKKESPELLEESKKITEGVDQNYFKKFHDINEKYLPDSGEGETLASQIVTAINKLVYKWYNDGDVYDNVNSGMQGWANDLSSYANWLDKYCDRASKILDSIYNCSTDDEYENILKALADKCLDKDYLITLEEPKQGSIYDCDGQFEFSLQDEEDEFDDYYDSEDY